MTGVGLKTQTPGGIPNISSNTNLSTVITNPHHHTSTNEPILYILSLPPSLRLVC